MANDGLVLFDEPLSNVDARVREQLRFELAEMQERLRFAAVYVTHDQIEALSLADRVAVMGDGQVQQLGTPRQIYAEPASRYVANFIGTTNEFSGTMRSLVDEDLAIVETHLGVVEATLGSAFREGAPTTLTCRPEDCTLNRDRPEGSNVWLATIQTSMFMGSHTEYLVTVGELSFKVWSRSNVDIAHGEQYWLHLQRHSLRALAEDVGADA